MDIHVNWVVTVGDRVLIMGKVQLKIPPSLVSTINKQVVDWVILEPEIAEGATIGDLLAKMASGHVEFRQAIFDPGARRVSDEILVVLNDSLVPSPEAAEARLNDGDSVILLPVYSGG